MKKQSSEGLRKTILDNFQVGSFRLNQVENEGSGSYKGLSNKNSKQLAQIKPTISEKQSLVSSKKNDAYYQNDFGGKGFVINGINYFTESMIVNEDAQILQDCYSVKGDYFYLKKGQNIKVLSKVGEYVQIKYQRFVGFFPSKFFKLSRY